MKANPLPSDDQDLPVVRRPPPKRNPHAAEEWALARAFHKAIVPVHAESSRLSTLDVDSGRRRFYPEWEYRRRPCDTAELRGALFHGDKLAPRKVGRVRYFVLDVDAHAAAAAAELPPNVRGLDAQIRMSMGAAVAKRRRVAVRDAAWETCLRLLERVPEAVATQTKRGYQLIALLEEDHDAAPVAAMAAAFLEGLDLPAGVDVEVFPNRDGEGWQMPSLPLTGTARLVGHDGLKRIHRSRRQDVAWLLGHAPRLTDPPEDTRDPGDVGVPSSLPASWHESGSVGGEDGGMGWGCSRGGRECADDGSGIPQTRGRDFREQLGQVLTEISDGQSRWAVAKFVAGCFYLAVPQESAEHAFCAWVLLPEHGATKTGSAGGRRALRAMFRLQWRRYERLVARGIVKVGRMRAPEIRARYAELAAGTWAAAA